MARAKKDKQGRFYEVIELPRGIGNKRRRKFIRAWTVGELKKKIEQFHIEQEQGLAPVRAPQDHTVASWGREFLNGIKQRESVRESTYWRYDSDFRNHIVPTIGHIKLRALTLDDVQKMIDYCHVHGRKKHRESEGSGLAPRTVHNILSPLLDMLEAARVHGLIKVNFARDAVLPKASEPDLYHFTPDEIRRFLDAVKGDRFEALFWLAALGFREGELLALRWSDIDLDTCTIRIVKGMRRLKQTEGKSKMTWVDPKTSKARRLVRFPEDWRSILLVHQAQQNELRSVEGWQEYDLVFPSTRGTPMEAQNFVARHFKPALSRAGLPAEKIRFHDMRHGAASMLIALGYDPRTVADILGHASPDTTLRMYAHSFDAVRERATADVGKMLKESSERVIELPPRKAKQEREP